MVIHTQKYGKWLISFTNKAELSEMLRELYGKRYYQFKARRPDPVIFDVGALIGETVLYFKDLYPKAKIVAFEPSPRSFKLLQRNVKQNRLTGVKLVKAAVGRRSGYAKFYVDKNPNNPWGRGDSLKENRFSAPEFAQAIQVRVVKLSSYINSQVDLLKLDIEGVETEVIAEIEPKLKFVDQLILEFHHSRFNLQNSLQAILTILGRNDYSTHFYLGKWPIPALLVGVCQTVLKLAGISEYWMRVYANRKTNTDR